MDGGGGGGMMYHTSSERPYLRLGGPADRTHGGGGGGGGSGGSRAWPPVVRYILVLVFLQTLFMAIVAIVSILIVAGVATHRGVVEDVVTRMATVENLARNVDDAAQVVRRALGDLPLDPASNPGGLDGQPIGSGADGFGRWLKPRDPAQEALITDRAAEAVARGVRTLVRLMEQAERARLSETVARAVDHADRVLMGQEASLILRAAAEMVSDPRSRILTSQGAELLAHLEAAALPLADALAAEIRAQLAALAANANGPGNLVLMAEEFRAMVHEAMGAVHNVGSGLSALVTWYRSGGPADAAVLTSDLVRTLRELIESPAADSLVQVLGGIDWKQTGARLGNAAHNGNEILRAVNEAGTVEAGDRLIRAVVGVLEDPGTRRAMAMLPAIAANATALLAQPNAQRLLVQGTSLMSRIDSVLGEAEAARTVERGAEFLGTLRSLLGALIDGGLHLELGTPFPESSPLTAAVSDAYPEGTGAESPALSGRARVGLDGHGGGDDTADRYGRPSDPRPAPPPNPTTSRSPADGSTASTAAVGQILQHGFPRVTDVEPEKTRGRRPRPRGGGNPHSQPRTPPLGT